MKHLKNTLENILKGVEIEFYSTLLKIGLKLHITSFKLGINIYKQLKFDKFIKIYINLIILDIYITIKLKNKRFYRPCITYTNYTNDQYNTKILLPSYKRKRKIILKELKKEDKEKKLNHNITEDFITHILSNIYYPVSCTLKEYLNYIENKKVKFEDMDLSKLNLK